MERYRIALLEKVPCAPDVVAFRFARPAGYEYRAGQYGVYGLETSQGQERHTFTHASAPFDPHLELMTRISDSAFKQALDALEPGDEVSLAGPGGRFALPDDVRSVVFLIGGVGITPVRSMLRDAVHRGQRFDDALLIFGNRDDTCVPYREELEAMAPHGLRIVHVFEHAPDGWEGETGFVTAEMVARHVDTSDERPFYVAGPPVMVTAMERVLDELGIAEDRRRIERFGS